MPICIKCGNEIPGPTQEGQDNSTFVCETCQNVVNLKVWEAEEKDLDKKAKDDEASVGDLRRLDLVRILIAKAKQE